MRAKKENAFWTLERKDGESARQFILRTWAECYLDLTALELETAQAADFGSAVTVKDGYASPYEFGRVLRMMVCDDKATIFGAHHSKTATIYYCWNSTDDGPTMCALYDPALRQGKVYEVDYFDAVDFIADTSPSESELGA